MGNWLFSSPYLPVELNQFNLFDIELEKSKVNEWLTIIVNRLQFVFSICGFVPSNFTVLCCFMVLAFPYQSVTR